MSVRSAAYFFIGCGTTQKSGMKRESLKGSAG